MKWVYLLHNVFLVVLLDVYFVEQVHLLSYVPMELQSRVIYDHSSSLVPKPVFLVDN